MSIGSAVLEGIGFSEIIKTFFRKEMQKDRWQTNIKSLRQGIHYIHDTGEFSDVLVKVGKKVFKAHKLVLSAKCSEFARILLSPDATDVLIVEDDSPVTEIGFQNLLHFIYKDDLESTEKKSVVEAYLASEYYKQGALMERCEKIMNGWTITVAEVCPLLNASSSIAMLKNKCLQFIRDNASEVISSPGFLDLNFRSLSFILQDGILDAIPALTRIEKIMALSAKHQNHTEPVDDYTQVRKDMLANEPPLLGLLGFHSLTLEEIAQIVAKYNGLLELSEIPIFMTSKVKKDNSLLPKWAQVKQ